MEQNGKGLTIHISLGTIVKSVLILLAVWFLFLLKDLVLVVLTAVVLAAAIEPAVKWFMGYKIPRVIGVLLVYLTVALLFAGLFFFFVPVALDEFSGLLTTLPEYLDTVSFSNPFTNTPFLGSSEVSQSFSLSQLIDNLRASIGVSTSGGFLAVASTVFGGILSFILVIVFSFYFAVQENNIRDFLRLVTPIKNEEYVIDLWNRSRAKIGKWMQGQLVLALLVGVLVYLGLTILGVRFALLLAITAALFEIIPVFGPILASVPAIGIAFAGGGLGLALLVIGLFAIIQQFENHLIYPLVVTKVVGVPPLLVILALIIGANLAGFLGIILSVPAAAVIQELAHDIQKGKRSLFQKEKVEAVS